MQQQQVEENFNYFPLTGIQLILTCGEWANSATLKGCGFKGVELHRLSTPMDRPSGSIQSRGPPASTWLNTTQRACGETLVTVCHCPDAHLQSPSGVKRVQEGAGALWRVEEHHFDLLPVHISRGGSDVFGKVGLEHHTKEACLKYLTLEILTSVSYTQHVSTRPIWCSVPYCVCRFV